MKNFLLSKIKAYKKWSTEHPVTNAFIWGFLIGTIFGLII
jgi:hypothetical protein